MRLTMAFVRARRNRACIALVIVDQGDEYHYRRVAGGLVQ